MRGEFVRDDREATIWEGHCKRTLETTLQLKSFNAISSQHIAHDSLNADSYELFRPAGSIIARDFATT